MECLECGNCRNDALTYYCAARNEFVISDQAGVVEKTRSGEGWKKGASRDVAKRKESRSEPEKTKVV